MLALAAVDVGAALGGRGQDFYRRVFPPLAGWVRWFRDSRTLPGSDHDRDLVFEAHRPISLVVAGAGVALELLSTMRLALLAQPCHGRGSGIVVFLLCSWAHERPF